MRRGLFAVTVAALLFSLACENYSKPTNPEGAVLLDEWTGPYGGVPAFDSMQLGTLKPSLETGMARQLAEIDTITSNADPATFENTIVAMEGVGRDLDRVFSYWGIWSSNLSTPEFREIQTEMAPLLSEFSTKITRTKRCSPASRRSTTATR